MFFTLSKILGFFLKAYNLIFFSILIYILLSKSRFRFLRGLSYFFGLFALLLVLVGSFSFIPNYFNWKFENWIETQVPNGPDGIILLGGSFTSSKKYNKIYDWRETIIMALNKAKKELMIN